jgi:glycosyltransferase involved in cell wall biosynthesis
MPVYNGERYVREALDALLAQTYHAFELVISDNGSTDGTTEICREYAARDPRIRYHRLEENRGAAWNFNNAFALARGAYFKWAAYDDLCAPTCLERCVEALDTAPPSVVLVYPKTRFIGERGEVLRDYEDELDLREALPHARLRHLLRRLSYANASFGLVRAEVLARTSLFGSYPSSDYVLLAELALLGQFWELPERLFLRREHPRTSRRAHPSGGEAAAWFDPVRRSTRVFEAWRVLRELVAAVARADLDRAEKARALAVCIPGWVSRNERRLTREALSLLVPVRWR